MHRLRNARTRRALGAALVALLMAFPLGSVAQAHPMKRFWTYGTDLRKQNWKDYPALRRLHTRWHRNHPDATWRKHKGFHHHRLDHRLRKRYAHVVVARQSGGASHYGGGRGACGTPLTGLYAAHRTWPCGTKVSVRRGSRYVVVTVRDRGPFISGRVIDLSREAFSRLGPLSAGVLDVTIYRLEKQRR